MKVFLSTKYSLDKPAGSSVVTMHHAKMFAEKGHDVIIFCPSNTDKEQVISGIKVHYYRHNEQSNFLFNRPNFSGASALQNGLNSFKPDILYDVHGPVWAILEASKLNIPVFSMVGDYNHLCLLNFLVTPESKRCIGPVSFSKCEKCISKGRPIKTRLVSFILRASIFKTIILLILGPDRTKRWDFQSAAKEAFILNNTVRDEVNYYIIGDKQAETVFSNYIDPQKIIINQQFLPINIQDLIKSKSKRARSDSIIFGYIGRIDRIKGFPSLLMAFLEIDDYTNIELWIVHKFDATSERIQSITNKRKKLKSLMELGKIKCFRPQDNDALYEIMSSFSVGVIPSIAYESPNVVLMELIAAKIPAIRSESDGMEHLIQNKVNGFSYPYDDPFELLNRIELIRKTPQIINIWKARLPELRNQYDYYKILSPYFKL